MKKLTFIVTVAFAFVLMSFAVAPAGPVLDRVLQKGELVVGTTGFQPPLNVINKEGKVIGLDADIAKLIAVNMGVKARFVTMPFSDLLPALQKGKVDMVISSMTMTLERNMKVAFVGPYYISGKGLLTKLTTVATIEAAEGLDVPGMKVAALEGSTSQVFVEKAAPKAKLVTTKSIDEAVNLLFEDKVDAVVADYPVCAFSAFRHRDKNLTAGEARLTFEPLGIAVAEDALLINWLENFMMVLAGSGDLERLQKRWLQDGEWIKQLP
ncbi:MAG: transporter substrate-binding domain-containing protein [Deltaproteobacteria bacterium]|nr:transporter substrate-binding domain-containing protein [Deltaproteobacteria bacterium]